MLDCHSELSILVRLPKPGLYMERLQDQMLALLPEEQFELELFYARCLGLGQLVVGV